MQVQGVIKVLNQTQQVSSSFSKREVVITTQEQYPQHILIEFNQDKCDLLNMFQVGQQVVVDVNLRGREWQNPQGETKFFNTIQGWKIAPLQQQAQQFQQPMQQQQFQGQQQQFNNNNNGGQF